MKNMTDSIDISRTAQSMALFRALETAKGNSRRLFVDPYAFAFLSPMLCSVVRASRQRLIGDALERYIDWGWPGARSSGVARTRLIDDWLVDAIDSGARQLVILGAGFDARAYRLTKLSRIKIFELDRATVLERKRDVLAAHQHGVSVDYAPVDFIHDDIAAVLLRAGLERNAKTVFIWEGVTNYLNCESVCDVFNLIARNAAPGSSVIFTYIHRDVLAGQFASPSLKKLLRQLEKWGEPWTFGFDPKRLPTFLRERGFELTEDMGATEYRHLYFGKRASKFQGYEFYRVACAHLAKAGSNREHIPHAAC